MDDNTKISGRAIGVLIMTNWHMVYLP